MLCTVGNSMLIPSPSNQSLRDEHLLQLFSPTALKGDLSYVDKTYYEQGPIPVSKESTYPHCTDDEKQPKLTDVSQHSLHAMILNHAVGFLTSMSHLELRSLNLVTLPDQISQISHLTYLDLSDNKLTTLPSTLQHLKHLRQLNLAHNHLTGLPPVLSHLHKLTTLDLSHNTRLSTISSSLHKARRLMNLDVSHTNIESLPAELASLLVIRIEQCPRLISSAAQYTLYHDPPSLLELCSRKLMVTMQQRVPPKRSVLQRPRTDPRPPLPDHLWDYMEDAQPCSFCRTPCVQGLVMRFRIIQRLDESLLPIHYRLCRAHWSDEADRLLSLFSSVF